MSKGALLTIGFLLFVSYLSFSLIWTGNKYECHACIVFKDREVCQTVAGVQKEETMMVAITTACGGAANGMTENIACQAQKPKSMQCKDL